jgi:hypothetical protein
MITFDAIISIAKTQYNAFVLKLSNKLLCYLYPDGGGGCVSITSTAATYIYIYTYRYICIAIGIHYKIPLKFADICCHRYLWTQCIYRYTKYMQHTLFHDAFLHTIRACIGT